MLSFTEQRFRPMTAATDDQSADRAENAAAQPADSVDLEMAAWLKQQRTATRIVFKQEAFQ